MNTIPERYTFTNPIVMKVLTDGARMGIFPRPASKEVRPFTQVINGKEVF